MKIRFASTFALWAVLLILAGCKSDLAPKKPTHGYLPDSLANTESNAPSTGNAAAEEHKNELPPAPKAVQAGANETFEQRNARFVSTVFPDYKQVEMDPMDAFPMFKTASKSGFHRLRKIKPTSTSVGSSTYPRLLVRSYRFASWEALKAEVEAWFDGMEHSAGTFAFGEKMDALKSPPMLCLVDETHFMTVQWSCIYANAEWKESVKKFFEWADLGKARYSFEVTCQAGRVKYHKTDM